MPLPEPGEQEGESVSAGQEPAPGPGTHAISAAPRKPRKFSKLVLLTASKDSAKAAGAKRKGVHCIVSLGPPGPATLAKALLKTHPEAQRAIEAAPQEPEQKRHKLAPGSWAVPGISPHGWKFGDTDTKEADRLAGGPPAGGGEEAPTAPSASPGP
ncbi:FLYWCH family member 2 isoform X1 [Lepus europaeus]|uniref:FLYWCH family member 2 isoform X1 n=1 Tax=Lepus europaeus TaxID=9983 RepID=UPI002B4632C5|nr:FLYWCH family member 2 isoform X1 [Lepus europaeus]XP_062035872.1 FLYWCH family member 2 isoform X1 [Lepus europaeus]XP_062035873.1 FLYWCH family member 2 isoform X1 [Lepus europaeus]XP_062035874.1 FLYWCH family member 2 isoform X1 [Lepus europaeus]XP_062035875.1 FLYWCH family member 2 isoform X1 [Lepus europaeus]XP_062035876.1 FLYWCH family member 2 isoform X1 [Lepus europaeus]XP_062035877.1 FLYWCH family member 2 isoform X1 [Lepus europaeus]XP_062035879.1 FLYWCH family member 2 isoform 